jgi:hypothetical protein
MLQCNSTAHERSYIKIRGNVTFIAAEIVCCLNMIKKLTKTQIATS